MYRIIVPALWLAAPGLAQAQPVDGLYIGAGAGVNFMQSQDFTAAVQEAALTVATHAGPVTVPATAYTVASRNHFAVGGAALASIGYGFGNGVRLEIEADYRANAQRAGMVRPGVDVREQKFGAMANALFDLDIGSPYVFPYFGAGLGAMRVDRAYGPHGVRQPAYQGIAGAALPVPWVPGLSLTLEYRFMGLVDVKGTGYRAPTATTPFTSATAKYGDDANHALLAGLRYVFGVTGQVRRDQE